jgi:hypothetical protein
LHLQSLAPTPVSRRVDVRQAAGRKNDCRILSQHDEKHVVPTPLSGIRVGERKDYQYKLYVRFMYFICYLVSITQVLIDT